MIHGDLPAQIKQWRIEPGTKVKLADYDTSWAGDPSRPKDERRAHAETLLDHDINQLRKDQDVLYAADRWSVLVILQAMDAAGKDGVIKHVMSGLNPAGCQVHSFKQPSREELDHDFLWRSACRLPERGRIGIFNRSYYEELLVVRVHPGLIVNQRIPDADPTSDRFWKHRYDSINEFERHLTRNGTLVLKFFLHVSKEKQHERLLKRLTDPAKHWKFTAGDLAERARWDDYLRAYEKAITATSTKWAPWHIIPADYKWVTRTLVAKFLALAIEGLELSYPEVSEEQKSAIAEARAELEAEQQ